MIVLRKNTLSQFDISKKKLFVDFDGVEKNGSDVPTKIKCLFSASDSIKKINIKKSYYNIIKEYTNGCVIWNTASDACIILNDDEKNKYRQIGGVVETDFDKLLYQLGFLVAHHLDERFRMDFLRKKHAYSYPENKHLDIEIIPTQACNANCFYCFANCNKKERMSKATQLEVLKYLKSVIQSGHDIEFIWFGGEPLIEVELIDYFINEISDCYGDSITYHSAITTNNSLLSKPIIDRFIGLWHVNDILTEIDGYRDEHNKRKDYKNVENAYEKSLFHISKLVDTGINTTLRVNIDKNNVHQIDYILEDFVSYKDETNFKLQISPLRNNKSNMDNSVFYRVAEYQLLYANIIGKLFDYGFYVDPLMILPRRDSSNCIACAVNKVVINSDGNLYRCVQAPFDENNRVGDCHRGVRQNMIYSKWFENIDNIGEECNKCKLLPCCQGGCAYHKMQKNIDATPCIREKYYIDLILDKIFDFYEEKV